MLRDWVRNAKERGASDLHLEAGTPVVLRVRGELVPVSEAVSGETLLSIARETLTPAQWQEFLVRKSADLSQTISGTRCRINIFQTVRGIGFAIRLLSSYQNNLRDSNLHPDLRKLVDAKTGLIILAGPTGSGKSTTLAALVEEMNTSQRRHILTVESPIEYYFGNKQSYVRQREVPVHAPSFEQAITDAMRENPDVLIIGEMRTPDVMRLTLNAAETGHLVLATMHSSTSAEALTRLCMSFAPEIQGGIRAQIADCLIGVICQRLMYLPQQGLQVPHCEILLANSGVRSTIRSGNFSQIISALQTGGEEGMFTFDRYLRWIEQKRDWVKPAQARPLAAQPGEERVAVPPPAPTPMSERPRRSPPAPPIRAIAPMSSEPEKSDVGRIEIDVSEDDLEALAKQIPDDE